MNRVETATSLFGSSCNCAQSVAAAFAPEMGIDKDFACKMATAFGAGGGRRQLCCGAVSGALLVISLLKGRGINGEKKEQAYALAREFFARFEERHSSSECRALLDNIDLLSTEGQERFTNENMKARCTEYVASAVEILQEMLNLA